MIILEPYLFTGFYQYDHELGFRVRPNVNGTNRFGFNDRDYPLARTPGTFRILVVGDSFSWAGGLEGNYAALLERKFDTHYGKHRVDVINSGYPMTNTAEQLRMLQRDGLRYTPDLVLLGFFAGNDFLDADPNRKRIVLNDTYFDIDPRRDYHLFGYPMVPRSRFIQFVKQRFRTWKDTQGGTPTHQTETESGVDASSATFSEEAFLRIEKARLELCNLQRQRDGEFRERTAYALESISRMRDLLHSKNIGFVVAIYPDEFQVNSVLLNSLLRRYGLEREQYDIDLMQQLLTKYLQRERIAHIDLLPTFRAQAQTKRLYLLRNTHWNRDGNALAAKILFSYFMSESLVPTVETSTRLHAEPSTEGE